MKIRTADSAARIKLSLCQIPLGADFHILSSIQVDALMFWADKAKYRAPKNANGSRGRYYHAFLQRLAAKQ